MTEVAMDNEETKHELTSRELVFGEIHRLRLEQNVLELEEQGYTVVADAIPMPRTPTSSPSTL